MNVHHLELFYYVARHGGISEAVHNMPYSIQQPSVSAQIIQLEEFLGVTLFRRRPFCLTPHGEKLYSFVRPFFENLPKIAEELHGGAWPSLRVAASETVVRGYVPAILHELRKQFPKLRVTLREGYDPEVITWLQEQEIDLFLGLLGGKPPSGICFTPMFKLPLILLVPKESALRLAQDLWKQDRIEESLITVPSNQAISRAFRAGLAKLKVDWFRGIEVSTVEMVQIYVAEGYGIGVTVRVPKMQYHPQVRMLPLAEFEPVSFGVLWQGHRTPLLDALFKIFDDVTRNLMEGEDQTLAGG